MSTMLRTENLTYSYPAGEENEQPTLALDGVTPVSYTHLTLPTT